MNKPQVTTEVPAEVVYNLCVDYLGSLAKAKDETEKNFYTCYGAQTKFSLLRMRRVSLYTHREALDCAKSSANWQLNTFGEKAEVIKIKHLAWRDLSATMRVNHTAWDMIHRRFKACTMENKHRELF